MRDIKNEREISDKHVRESCRERYPQFNQKDVEKVVKGVKERKVKNCAEAIRYPLLRLEAPKFDVIRNQYPDYWKSMMKIVRPRFFDKVAKN